jgi:hypothetical protein
LDFFLLPLLLYSGVCGFESIMEGGEENRWLGGILIMGETGGVIVIVRGLPRLSAGIFAGSLVADSSNTVYI